MSLNDESYLDDLLKAVTAEDNNKKEQTPLNVLEESESSNNGLIDDSEENLQIDEVDNEFSSDDLTQMLKSLEQIEDEPINLENGAAEVKKENFSVDSEELFFEEQEEEAPFFDGEVPRQEEIQMESNENIQAELTEDTSAESIEDYDLSNLLAGVEEDEELAEVNDLLQKDENHEAVEDDDILEMLERASQASEIEEQTDELLKGEGEYSADDIDAVKEPELKKRGRKRKEKKKKSADSKAVTNSEKIELPDDSNLLNDLNRSEDSDISSDSEFSEVEELLDIPEKSKLEKKPGFISKLLSAFFEADDELEIDGSSENNKDNVGEKISEATEDNLEVLKELEEEDKKRKKNGKKKGKKEEEKEEKEDGSENEEKGKKKKKPKKEKAPKESIELTIPEKKLSRKKITIIAMFNVSMLAGILIAVIFIPRTILLTDANKAFGNKEYKDTYKLLSGMKLGEDEEVIYMKSAVVLELQRKYEAFENYQILNMEMDALNALLQGIVRYDKLLLKAEELQIVNELEPVYQQIVAAIESAYGLSEEEAREIIAYDRVTYTEKLESMINGTEFIDPNAPAEEQVVLDDMLPEEESMIQNLQQELSTDKAQAAEDSTQPLEDSTHTAEEGTIAPAVGADAVQSGVVEQGTSGSVLYSGTIKDGKVTLSK